MRSGILERLASKRVRRRRLKNKVVEYLEGIPPQSIPDDQKEVLEYIREHDISVFPYNFPEEYDPSEIEIFQDAEIGLHYMMWEGKRLYFRSGLRKSKAVRVFNRLLLEQDVRSPHRYLSEDFDIAEGDVVVDVGAAEGNFSLSVVEKAGFIYLFEPDERWIKALEATFAPWKHKVRIEKKFVSDKTNANSVALDDYFPADQTINFIKADVEGAEADVLRGARKILSAEAALKVAICTYHRQEDGEILEAMLKEAGYSTSFSDGYMLYYYGRNNVVREPYLRRAVLRAVRTPTQ